MSYFNVSDELKKFLGVGKEEISSFYFNSSLKIDCSLTGLDLIGITQHIVGNSLSNILGFKFDILGFLSNSYDLQWSIAISESIKNAYDHGLALKNGLSIELYVGNKALGFGISDGGDFYKNPDIKKLIQERILPPREDFPSIYRFEPERRGRYAGRNGFKKLYQHSDFLDVDLSDGVLFMGFFYEHILKKR